MWRLYVGSILVFWAFLGLFGGIWGQIDMKIGGTAWENIKKREQVCIFIEKTLISPKIEKQTFSLIRIGKK